MPSEMRTSRRKAWWKRAGPSVQRAEARLKRLETLALQRLDSSVQKRSRGWREASAARCMQLPAHNATLRGTERPLGRRRPKIEGSQPHGPCVLVKLPRGKLAPVSIEVRGTRPPTSDQIRKAKRRYTRAPPNQFTLVIKKTPREWRKLDAYIKRRACIPGAFVSLPGYRFRVPARGLRYEVPAILRYSPPNERWSCSVCRKFCPRHEPSCSRFGSTLHDHRWGRIGLAHLTA
jgi:hypothetical protein